MGVALAFLPFLAPGPAWADSLLQGQGTGNARQSLSPAGRKASVCFHLCIPGSLFSQELGALLGVAGVSCFWKNLVSERAAVMN